VLRLAIEEAEETVTYVQVDEISPLANKTLRAARIPEETGLWVLAIKRENKWIYSFKPGFVFLKGDLLIGLGPKETVEQWKKCVHPEKYKED